MSDQHLSIPSEFFHSDEWNEIVNYIAVVAHEANRAYCISIGDNSQLPWNDAPEHAQKSAIEGVKFHFANKNANAGDSHRSWHAFKLADGWSYGPEKDILKKRHPCMVPFEELPIEQQIKDHVFRSVVHGLITTTLVAVAEEHAAPLDGTAQQ